MNKQLQHTVKWVNSKKKILFVLFILIALLGTAIYRFVVQNNWLEEEFSKQTQNIELHNELSKLSLYIKNAESANRGYAISGDKKFIENFDITIDSIRSAYLQVKQLDNRKIDVEGASLFIQSDKLIERKIDFMKRVKSLCDNNNCQAALALISTNKGQQLSDSITKINNQISINLEAHLKSSQKNFLYTKRINSGIAYFGIAVSTLLILIIFYLLTIQIRKARKVSDELRVQKENYRVTLNSLGEGLITTDMEGQVLYMNPSAEKLTGWNWKDAEKLPLHEVFNVVNEETGQSFEHIVSRILKSGKKVEWENNTILKAKNASTYIISNNGSPIVDVQGNISGSVLVFNDITEKKEKEILLQKSEEKYRSMVELNPAGIYQTTVEGKILSCNNAFAAMLGYDSEKELKQIDVSLLYFSGSNRHDFLSLLKRTGKLYNQEIKLKHKNGNPVYMIDNCSLQKNIVNGEEIIEGVLINVTERKMAEQQLAESEKNLRHVLSSASESFYVIDRKCYITLINKTASENLEKAWGKPVNVGTNILPLIPKEDDEPVRGSLVKVFAGEPVEYELDLFIQNLPACVQVNYLPVKDDSGVIVGAYISTKDITEKKYAEERIKSSEARLNQAQAVARIGSWETDLQTLEVIWSEETFRIFEISAKDFKPTHEGFLQHVHPDDVLKVNTAFHNSTETDKLYSIEHRLVLANQNNKIVQECWQVFKNDQGEPVRAVGTCQDITERKIAENKLNVITNDLTVAVIDLNKILDSSLDVICTIDGKGDFIKVSNASQQVWGYTPQELIGTKFMNLVYEEDADITIKAAEKILSGTQIPIFENRYLHKSGRIVHMLWSVNWDEKLQLMFCVAKDVTESKKVEEAIRESNERYELVTKATSDMVWDWNVLTGEVYRSKEGWKKIFKADAVKYAGNEEDWQAKIHPDDKERVETIRQELISSVNKDFFEIECRVLTDDGEYADIHDKGYIIRNNEGKPVRIIGASSDVTQQKQAEEEVKKLSLIARETVNTVIITDADEKIQWVNEAFTRMTEYTLEEVIGKNPGHFLQGPETNPVVVRFMRAKIKRRQNFECDIINYSKSGKKHWVRIQCQPEFDATGKLISFFSIQTEITKEKEIEEALKSSEERYRHLFDNNPESIFIWDMDTLGILEVNNTAVQQYGYTKEEFTQLTLLDMRPPEQYSRIEELVKQMKTHPEKSGGIWKHRNKAGGEMYMSIVSDQILYKGKMVVLAIANNITEKILLEKVLEEERVLKTQEITDAVISAQENERQELGRELHDNINQILASSRLYLGMAKKDVTGNIEYIAETDNLINTAIAEIRTLSHTLIPPSLGESGLIEALDDIIHITAKTTSITIQKSYTGICEKAISDKFKLTMYRIVQEQFNNIIKYAHAKTICLQLSKQNNKMTLSIKDDGVGFDTAKKAKGVGLINIQTRASLFNGEVNIISSPGNGCELTVVFSEE